jgi:hypothetical protein
MSYDTQFPFRVILGNITASVLALYPIIVPRAVNDSLQARISGGRMTGVAPLVKTDFSSG